MNKTLLVILFLQIFSVTMGEYYFSYAYRDGSYSPSYPKKGNSFRVQAYGYPFVKYNAVSGNSYTGDWVLTSKGNYTGSLYDYPGYGNLAKTVSDLANQYKLSTNQMPVWELLNGDTHIAYGFIMYLDNTMAEFYSDNGNYFAPTILSTTSLSGTYTKRISNDPITTYKANPCDRLLGELRKKISTLTALVNKK